MSNKILLFTDNHFCSTSSILRKRGNKYTVRLENQIATMNWLVKTAIDNDCFCMFSLGDFFDSPNLTAEELSCLSEINLSNIPTSFIVGNHEMGNATLEYSSAHSFLINQSCDVYNKPAIIGIGNTLIYILPYQLEINRKENIMDYFPTVDIPDNVRYKVLLMHNDISGISMGKFVSKEGFSKDDLSSNFDLVINGHIHNQSWVTSNILNLGNITGQNFSEDSTKYKHQCMIIDCDTLEYKLITNPEALNFCKIDFTGKNSDIDYINSISSKVGNNAVLSIKCEENDFYYIKHRFDPESEQDNLIPRNCNVLQTRIILEKSNTTVENSEETVENLKLDYLNEFQDYILNQLGNSDTVIKELEEILH